MKYSPELIEHDRIQKWMQSVITNPDGVERGIASNSAHRMIDLSLDRLESVICRSAAQSSVDRLRVYADAYYARLLEVLESEFPALTYALGSELFREFAVGYLQESPSRSYTLADLSAKFPEYLAHSRPPRDVPETEPDWADFLIDLAILERTYSEVFDGPGVEGQSLLRADDLRAIPAESWPQTRLITVPCLRLLALRYPVHEYVTSVRKNANPDLQEPSLTWLLVTRRDFIVRRVSIGRSEYAALETIRSGGTVAEALNAATNDWPGEFDQLVEEVKRWFRDWSEAGYFFGLDDPAG